MSTELDEDDLYENFSAIVGKRVNGDHPGMVISEVVIDEGYTWSTPAERVTFHAVPNESGVLTLRAGTFNGVTSVQTRDVSRNLLALFGEDYRIAGHSLEVVQTTGEQSSSGVVAAYSASTAPNRVISSLNSRLHPDNVKVASAREAVIARGNPAYILPDRGIRVRDSTTTSATNFVIPTVAQSFIFEPNSATGILNVDPSFPLGGQGATSDRHQRAFANTPVVGRFSIPLFSFPTGIPGGTRLQGSFKVENSVTNTEIGRMQWMNPGGTSSDLSALGGPRHEFTIPNLGVHGPATITFDFTIGSPIGGPIFLGVGNRTTPIAGAGFFVETAHLTTSTYTTVTVGGVTSTQPNTDYSEVGVVAEGQTYPCSFRARLRVLIASTPTSESSRMVSSSVIDVESALSGIATRRLARRLDGIS